MANNQRTNTSTQIRNFYSEGLAYMNVSFYNTNLSIKMQPFKGKDQLGRNSFDSSKAIITTIDFDSAYLLWSTIKDIEDGKDITGTIPIPCGPDATLEFERKPGPNGFMESFLNISKNNITISFKFRTIIANVNVNGQPMQKVIEVGLGSFSKTINGYLEGINADRHLDKLTDDYIRTQQPQNQNNGGGNNNYQKPYNNGNNNGGYRNNSYRRNYNNNNRNYNNNQGGNNNWNNNNSPKQQDMSSYTISN